MSAQGGHGVQFITQVKTVHSTIRSVCVCVCVSGVVELLMFCFLSFGCVDRTIDFIILGFNEAILVICHRSTRIVLSVPIHETD